MIDGFRLRLAFEERDGYGLIADRNAIDPPAGACTAVAYRLDQSDRQRQFSMSY